MLNDNTQITALTAANSKTNTKPLILQIGQIAIHIQNKNIKSVENIVNTLNNINNSNIVDNYMLLNFLMSNFSNIDSIIKILNNLHNVLLKFQKLSDKNMCKLNTLGTNGQIGLARSSKS